MRGLTPAFPVFKVRPLDSQPGWSLIEWQEPPYPGSGGRQVQRALKVETAIARLWAAAPALLSVVEGAAFVLEEAVLCTLHRPEEAHKGIRAAQRKLAAGLRAPEEVEG